MGGEAAWSGLAGCGACEGEVHVMRFWREGSAGSGS